MAPSSLQTIGVAFNFDVFLKIGPFAAFGLVLNSALNPFIYGFRHHDIRQAMIQFLGKRISCVTVHPVDIVQSRAFTM